MSRANGPLQQAAAKKRTARVRQAAEGPRKILGTLKELRRPNNVHRDDKKAIEKAIRRKMGLKGNDHSKWI